MNTLYELHGQMDFGLDIQGTLVKSASEIILQEQVSAYSLQRFSVHTKSEHSLNYLHFSVRLTFL